MSDTILFRIVPIDAMLADSVRREQRSPQYGHPATVEVAKGYGPCRQCLRTFRVGEEDRILFTYNPVPKENGLAQPGPIFIHKDPCAAFEGSGFPQELRGLPLFLEGFGRGHVDGAARARRGRVDRGGHRGDAARSGDRAAADPQRGSRAASSRVSSGCSRPRRGGHWPAAVRAKVT